MTPPRDPRGVDRRGDLPLWEDDPFVRSAIAGLPTPEHHPDFWDALAGRLDDAAEELGIVPAPRRLPTRAAGPQPAHPPRVAPLRAAPRRPAPPAPVAGAPVRVVRATEQVFVPAPDAGPAVAARHERPRRRPPHAPDPDVEVDAEVEVLRDLAVVPQALRKGTNVAMAVMAVAAAVVVVVAGVTLVRQRSDDGVPAGEQLASVTNTSFVTEEEGSRDAFGGIDDPASQAVLAWIEAVGDGDAAAAWDALGSGSRAFFGDERAFEDELHDLALGLGAWAGTTPDRVVVTPVTASDEGTLSIVTLVGTVEVGGEQEDRVDAVPVRITGGHAAVEPFADAGQIDFVTPEPDSEADADDAVVVEVPAGIDAPVIHLGATGPVRCGEAAGSSLRAVEGTSKQRCTFAPGGGDPTGERVVTVAFTSDDGTQVSARSMRYDAA